MKRLRVLFVALAIAAFIGLFTAFSLSKSSAARTSVATPGGQITSQRDQDLSSAFRHYELASLNTHSVAEEARGSGRVELVATERTYDLMLVPNDLRAPGYHAMETAAGGVLREVPSGPLRTYKGTVIGIDESLARFTIDEKTFEGIILTSDSTLFVEPASRYSQAAGTNDYVIYNVADLVKQPEFKCDVTLNARVTKAVEELAPRTEAVAALRVIEFGTEADLEMVTQFGGVVGANAEILGVLNQVDAVYQRDLGMTFSVTFQHGWTTTDGYSQQTQSAFLASFTSFWNQNFPATNPSFKRDSAHMWTAKAAFFGQGRASLGVTCNNPNNAYGWSSTFPAIPQKFILPAHEIAHNFNAAHSETVPGCADTIMIVISNNNTQMRFCQWSIDQIQAHIAANGTCLATRSARTRCDFDGDSKSDLAVFRPQAVGVPQTGVWYVLNSATGGLTGIYFGTNGDVIAPEDFDGDARTDFAIFRPSNGTWYMQRSRDGFAANQFGANGDRPVPADFDGDGKADLAVYRPSTGAWYILNSGNGSFTGLYFGTQGDLPAPADFDNDGRADIAVFRPSTGTWYIQQSRAGFRAQQFGASGDHPVPADYDGDGSADVGVFRSSNGGWYIINSADGSFSGLYFGIPVDLAVPADFDGDAKADIAVWRPTSATWYIVNSSTGLLRSDTFGATGDLPGQNAFVP